MSGNICKFCGATQQGDHYHLYQCGSWICASGAVVQSNTCQHRCLQIRLQHEQTIDRLRKRVATAIEALKTIDRYSIEGVYDFGAIGKYDKLGDWVHFEDLEAVVAILEGVE